MRKSIKKVVEKTIATGMIIGAFIGTIPIIAAPNQNRCSWYDNASSPNYIIRSNNEAKYTSMYVGAEYITGTSSTVNVKVYAFNGVSFKDVTARNYDIPKENGTFRLIANYAYEQGNCGCTTYTTYKTKASGNHAGRWVPDYCN